MITSPQAQVVTDVTLPITSSISPNVPIEYVITLRLSVEPVSWKYTWAEVVVARTTMVTTWKRTTTGQRKRLSLVNAKRPTQKNTYPRLKSTSERIRANAANPPGSSCWEPIRIHFNTRS